MSDRPVLLGMNNPISSARAHALYPQPPGCTGNRLWLMLSEACGASQRDYIRAFDRRNLLPDQRWDVKKARTVGLKTWEGLEGRTVCVLGQLVRDALYLPKMEPLEWKSSSGVRWCLLPHPSGLNRWYNEPLYRVAVGLRLEELYENWRSQQ